MNSLARTIDQALTSIGHGPRDILLETIESFENLGLPDEERVSAIATAVAASALRHHLGHSEKFLDAVQIWALESVGNEARSLPRIENHPELPMVAAAAELLSSGIESLLDALRQGHVGLQDRVVAELTIFTRLLGQHDVHTILTTTTSIAGAIAAPEFAAGDMVSVPLRDPLPLDRSVDLARIPAQGVA